MVDCTFNLVMLYERFALMVSSPEIIRDRRMTYRKICRIIGADRRALSSYIYDELGFTGREVVSRLREIERHKTFLKPSFILLKRYCY